MACDQSTRGRRTERPAGYEHVVVLRVHEENLPGVLLHSSRLVLSRLGHRSRLFSIADGTVPSPRNNRTPSSSIKNDSKNDRQKHATCSDNRQTSEVMHNTEFDIHNSSPFVGQPRSPWTSCIARGRPAAARVWCARCGRRTVARDVVADVGERS